MTHQCLRAQPFGIINERMQYAPTAQPGLTPSGARVSGEPVPTGRTRSSLQNRVMPTGEIVSHPARGMLMGNRGCIHTPERTLGVTRWRTKMWICCVLYWRGRRLDVMPPGRWTALFFLDEATALAVGRRPLAGRPGNGRTPARGRDGRVAAHRAGRPAHAAPGDASGAGR